jgi:hypothetical protein
MNAARCATLPFLALAIILAAAARLSTASQPAPTPEPIRLVVAYAPDVEKHFKRIPFRQGMTVADALDHAAAMPAPLALRYASRGTGERAFLTAIDGLGNEGGGPAKRNWLFSVNDRPGDRSYAVTPLAPGDTILWRFAGAQQRPEHDTQ